MALVAYDYGSDSENEDDGTSTVTIVPSQTISDLQNGHKQKSEDILDTGEGTISKLLSDLPKSKPQTGGIIEDQLEDFIPKYQPAAKEKKEKVRITIPSLSQFDDIEDDEPIQKKAKVSTKGSSLLAILPPVKGSPLSTKSFIPNTLKNKPAPPPKTQQPSTTTSLVPNNVRKKAELAKKAALAKIIKKPSTSKDIVESDDEDIELPETFDDEMWQKVCGRPEPRKVIETIVDDEPVSVIPQVDIAPEPETPYEGLDNAAFKELIGKSKRPVNVKLIDINEEEILAEKDLWMAKSLTDPDSVPKPAEEKQVDPTRKKKHHITYLAEQAKANEQEFKSQWAASKFTRTQTRAKYGF